MKNNIHPNFKKAAWINAIRIVINTVINIFALQKGADLGLPILMRLSMISILVEAIITLLISLGYEWMKWVMLVSAILNVLSLINISALLDKGIITNVKYFVSLSVDVIITVLLFKATERSLSTSDN